jgi:hypothetical protein
MASSYMNAFVPAAMNSGLGSLIGSYQDTSKDSSAAASSAASVKDDYAKSYVPASVPSSAAATYEHAPALKQPQPQPNYAPAYPSYEYKYPSYSSSHEYKAPSYGSHEYKAPSYGSHEYKAPSYGSHEYKAPSYGSHEYKAPSYGSHEYKAPSYGESYPAVLPPSILPQGAYPIHQPTITNTGETIIENLVGGIPFDCRGRSTGHWRDNKYCDIFHACVYGIQRKTYVCPYVGERTYFDETTRRYHLYPTFNNPFYNDSNPIISFIDANLYIEIHMDVAPTRTTIKPSNLSNSLLYLYISPTLFLYAKYK